MTTRMRPLALAFLFLAALPVKALDVAYIDRTTGQEIEIRGIAMGDADESPEGITIKKGAAYAITYTKVGMTMRRDAKTTKVTFPVTVPPLNVKDYQLRDADVAPVPYLLEFRPALSLVERANAPAVKEAERIKMQKQALPLFEQLKPKLPNTSRARRHVEFKYAETLYRLSLGDDKMREPAMTALAAYQKDFANGFQIAPALLMLAQLQEDAGDLVSVLKTYQDLAVIPGLSEELKITSLMSAARTLMKLGKFGEAKTSLTALKANLPADNPLTSKVQLYLAQCQLQGDNATEAQQAEKQLRQILAGTDDKSVKALAHNTLGDYYTKLKQDENAFWEYLRVDTLYTEDRFEHSRALYHLMRLFRDVKQDAERSSQVEEMLTKDPRFAGLEYQKKALKK